MTDFSQKTPSHYKYAWITYTYIEKEMMASCTIMVADSDSEGASDIFGNANETLGVIDICKSSKESIR